MATELGLHPTNLLQSVLDEVGVGMVIVERNGHIAMANRAGVKMFGGSDPTGLHLSEWRKKYRIHDSQGREIPVAEAPIMRALRGEAVEPHEVRVTFPDGSTRWFHGASYHFSVLGLSGVFVIFSDETKQIELRRAAQLLERLEVVERLASGLLHDFNNMLSVGSSSITLALDDAALPQTTRAYLQQAALALQKGKSLIRRLAQYNRREPIHICPLQVNAAVAGAMELVRPLLDKRIRVNLDLQQDLPLVEADAGEIEQVLVNLIFNALDAMAEGGDLTVCTQVTSHGSSSRGETDKPNECVLIQVIDTGVGIPEHLQAKIFEPFFTTKADGRGTGLGLSSASAVVHEHGGDIEVRSAPGAGSTFNIYLPVAPCSEPAGKKERAR
jgi:signal transduction histidine kinase